MCVCVCTGNIFTDLKTCQCTCSLATILLHGLAIYDGYKRLLLYNCYVCVRTCIGMLLLGLRKPRPAKDRQAETSKAISGEEKPSHPQTYFSSSKHFLWLVWLCSVQELFIHCCSCVRLACLTEDQRLRSSFQIACVQ